MDILSYPVGLLIGLLPVAVDLGPEREPAHLLLDSRPVCELTARSPGCMVDLGLSPRIHLLELVRTDPAGRVTERVGRWVNRPGVQPEVLARGSCDEKKASCEFDFAWAHPRRLDPDRLDLSLDGRGVWHGKERHARVALAKGAKPQILVVDARFSDGTRASFTKTLYAFYPEEAHAQLQAVPVIPSDAATTDEQVASTLEESGLPVRTVERNETDIAIVMQPNAFDFIPGMMAERLKGPGRHVIQIKDPTGGARKDTPIQVVVPDQTLSAFATTASQIGRSAAAVTPRSSRFADAVAAAGYTLAGSPRPRAVVLVLHGFALPNVSTFTAAQARAYLSEVMVPLVVWRVGDVPAPEWPEGRSLASGDDLRAAFNALFEDVARQRIAWLASGADLSHSARFIVPGVALAGRTRGTAAEEPGSPAAVDSRAHPIGPDGGLVHALASAGDGKLVWAGTHSGVFRSRDGGAHWERAGAGLPPAAVRCIVAGPGLVVAGTDAGLFSSEDGGSTWSSLPALVGRPVSALAFDAARPATLYAAVRGLGVLRSQDSGATFLETLLDHGDVRSLLVDSDDRSVWAASDEGVLRSVDRGWTWSTVSPLPARALSMAADAGGRVWAATSGAGLFVTSDRGATWKTTGLSSALLDSVALSGDGKTIIAGSPDGVFSSIDGGAKWKLARVGPVEALASAGAGEWLACGPRGVLRAPSPGRAWSLWNTGLAADVVFSARATPGADGSVLAATARGLLRGDGGAWKPVAGVADGLPVFSVAPNASGTETELLVGSAGEIGRSFESGTSWSWQPASSVFGFAEDPADARRMLAATRGAVLRSEDGGISWTESSVGLTRTFPLQVALDSHEPSSVYAASAGSGIFRSTDGGKTWKPGGSELARSIVRSVAVDPNAATTVYAGTDRGVYGSVTGGKSWTPLFGGLPPSPVYALALDPESPLELFAGTATGLFQSNDAGGHWTPFPSAGAIPAGVASLWLDSARGELVVGTLGAGVWVVRLRGD